MAITTIDTDQIYAEFDPAAVTAGIERAFDGWLADRSVTVPNCIAEAVRDAFTDWLDRNGAAVLAALVLDR